MNNRRKLTKDVTIYDSARTFDGYTLFAPTFGTDAWLIDMQGRVVNHWEMAHAPASHGRLLPNGNLMWQGKGPGSMDKYFVGSGSELVEVDWDGNEVWRYDEVGLNHDFLPLENGNVIVNVFQAVPDDLAKAVKGGIPGTELNGKIYSACFKEITREGETLWQWKAYEHLDPEADAICPLCNRHVWGFNNSLALMPDGKLLFTLRLLNRVCMLDRQTGRVVWQFGEGEALGHPHCCTALENGNVLLFDNGLHRYSSELNLADFAASRVIEIDPKAKRIVWKYQDPLSPNFFSAICAGAQRLPNGNTLICEATKGRIFEVTVEGQIVWEYFSPFTVVRPNYWGWTVSATIWQAHRYPPDFPGLAGKDLDPHRFEWVIQKRSQAASAEAEALKRLESLGY